MKLPVATNIVSDLITDFVALELIIPSKKKHSVSDDQKYWTLTPLGKQLIKKTRRFYLEKNAESNVEQ